MCLLFESIRIENRQILNLSAHLDRMESSREKLWNIREKIDIDCIRMPDQIDREIWKCRIEYDTAIRNISFTPYRKKRISKVRMIEANHIRYDFKYADRRDFDKLFRDNPGFDEFLITRNGFLTDSTFTNLALFDGINWHTPLHCLLKGCRRRSLIEQGMLSVAPIHRNDLKQFTRISLINAMLDLEELTIDIQDIYE
ncbi:MAG TPA: aminotransferase class IV [Bacteroidales bacterium]|nr:aminotransferase class IV [Bacteroidales bacterium]HSA42397.1 aminotransferase class IV [Bacteroidales bacterium]